MKKHRQDGFSLVEVLVSVFVLALGVVGAAGMQLIALRTGQQLAMRTIATELASEMADAMRANAGQMNQSDGTNPFLAVSYDAGVDGAPAAPAKKCYGSADCTPGELAAFDIYEWKLRLKAALPGGRVKICRDSAPFNSAATTPGLTWDCTANAATGSAVIKVGWHGKDKDSLGAGKFPPNVAITVETYIR